MTRKVAVVAVHGVADQTPASSARSIADLLCTDKEYGSFTEFPMRIARERMEPGCTGDEKTCRGEHLPENADPGVRYMHDQLKEYRGPGTPRDEGTVYDTVRLEGKRLSDGARVHVHEVYWADLSRAGNTWYRLIAEFYQLILHLPSLGRNGLALARQANGNTGPWKFAHNVQRFAVWLLTVPTALINVVLLSVGIIALSAEIPVKYQEPAAIALTTLLVSAVLIAGLRVMKKRELLWALWLPIVIGVGVGVSFFLSDKHLYQVLALEAAVVAAGACIFIAKKYDAMKKNRALPFGLVAALAMLGIAVFCIWGRVPYKDDVYSVAVETAQYIYPAIVVTWMLVFATTTLAAVAGVVAALSTERSRRAAAWRAAWTARLSLAMPAALFAVFTLSIWYLVIEGIKWLAGEDPLVKAWQPAFIAAKEAMPSGYIPVGEMMNRLLLDSAQGFEFFAMALFGFLAFALFATVPSVLVELKHPRPSDDAESASLGRWLTKGMLVIAVGAELFTLSMLVMLVLSVIPRIDPLLNRDQLVGALAASAGAVALLITGKYFVKTFRSLVDVMLDIDNYLRESPGNATPRARIAERYAALLRHLAEWRDADDTPYDQIIIIAHSQGTVISADALRYLNAVPDPRLKAINDNTIPLRLFTMGSPLRQIYAQAFPHLYGWITETETDIVEDGSPDPRRLTLQQWANVYCSGDYVGRNVWRLPEARLFIRKRAPAFQTDGTPYPRVDFCAGAGAHTHYWDRNGEDVAAYLKELI